MGDKSSTIVTFLSHRPLLASVGKSSRFMVNRPLTGCAPSCFEQRSTADARVGLEQFATAVFLPQIHTN
ncbi:MAG: hypothetical protein ACTHLY_06495 [Pseudolabrys sp.]